MSWFAYLCDERVFVFTSVIDPAFFAARQIPVRIRVRRPLLPIQLVNLRKVDIVLLTLSVFAGLFVEGNTEIFDLILGQIILVELAHFTPMVGRGRQEDLVKGQKGRRQAGRNTHEQEKSHLVNSHFPHVGQNGIKVHGKRLNFFTAGFIIPISLAFVTLRRLASFVHERLMGRGPIGAGIGSDGFFHHFEARMILTTC